jgi:tRNA uridine 5-carboxymethylaminomethyl modification enzyme
VGLVDEERWARFVGRRDRYTRNKDGLERTFVRDGAGDRVPAAQFLRQPEVKLADLLTAGDVKLDISEQERALDLASVETAVKYEGYLRRQQAEVERSQRGERRRIPPRLSFELVPGLSREVVQRLSQIRPETLGQALRVPGVTPAAVAVLDAYLERMR